MYCSTTDAFRAAGITTSEITDANMKEFVKDAEADVDRLTNTTYWAVEDSGTATSSTTTTIVDTGKTWTADAYIGDYVWIYGGTGINQIRKISDNDTTSLTVDTAWTTNPSTDSTYRIIHCGHDPRRTDSVDGDNSDTIFLRKYPLVYLASVSIDSTSITTTNIWQYTDSGKLVLSGSAEKTVWTSKKARLNVLTYWYGVYTIPREVLELTAVYAAIKALNTQMGGTHNMPSSFQLPEGSVTMGQAYVNIKATLDSLYQRAATLEPKVRKYAFLA